MEGKKISFGFMKTKKVEKLPVQEKKDFIECVEEKSIKVVGGDEVKEVAPLVIPMKPNTLITSERLQQIAEKVESALEEPEKTEAPLKPENKAPENETLEQMAVRELLEDSKKDIKAHTPQMMMVLPAKSIAGGEKESTLDDYESVPIQDFGLAMLRGMGWTKTDEKSSYKPPQLRPKGLGLGADKVVKDNNKEKANKNSREAELTIVMNAFVKITTGKYSGYYGKVVSLDEDNGRVMVDIPMKKETVSLSEFMMYPVTKSEFDKESKVINAIFEGLSLTTNPILFAKMDSNPYKDANSFEQYKKNEGQKSRNSDKEPSRSKERNRNEKESNSSNENNNRIEKEKQKNKDMKERNQDKSKREKHRDTSEDKHSRKKRDSSNESMSNSDSERNTKKKRKSKKQYSSMESLDSDTERRYKKKDLESDHRRSKKDKERKRHESNSDTDRKSRKSNKECRRQNSDSESERKKKDKEQKRYDSVLESDHRIRKKTEKERSRHVSSSDSDYERSKRSDTPDAKRDIDKKRKGKKKKRDRDRSPHHRRHRK